MDAQRNITQVGGTMRLGSYPCHLTPGSKAHQAFGKLVIHERHRHRYEVNPAYRAQLEAAGLTVSGASPDQKLVEVVELADHPWFVAVQSHPEFLSKPTAPHPLFRDFVGAGLRARLARRTEEARAARLAARV